MKTLTTLFINVLKTFTNFYPFHSSRYSLALITFVIMHFTTFINSLKNQDGPLTFDNVKAALEAKKLVVKSFNKLHIVSYPKRRITLSDANPDFNDPLVRECRGVIFDSNFNVVCPGFNKFYDNETDKYLAKDDTTIEKVPELSLNSPEFAAILADENTDFSYAVDSSLVRLYHHDGRWKLATTRSIDASKTRWNSYRTFYQLFCDGCESQFSPLDWQNLPQENVYMLALVHPENRIVTPHTQPMLLHLTTFTRGEGGDWAEDLTSDLNIAKAIPFSIEKEGLTGSKLQDVVANLNWVYPGVVVRWTDEYNIVQRTKLRNPAYEHVARLRGERRSMVERYLELKTSVEKQNEFAEFLGYYPEYKAVEGSIENLARLVHQMYLDFHVHHTVRFIADKQIWNVLQELHTRFLRTREKTTLDLTRQHVHSLSFPVLSQLLVDNQTKK